MAKDELDLLRDQRVPNAQTHGSGFAKPAHTAVLRPRNLNRPLVKVGLSRLPRRSEICSLSCHIVKLGGDTDEALQQPRFSMTRRLHEFDVDPVARTSM
jgi:hypothetical protein